MKFAALPSRKPTTRRNARASRRRRLGRDRTAASDIVGNLLLIAITVVSMAGLWFLVLSFDGPDDTQHSDLRWLLSAGDDGSWGTGDESIALRHFGGEAVDAEGLRLRVEVDGAPEEHDTPADHGFTDGQLRIGESWQTTRSVSSNSEVRATAFTLQGNNAGGALLASTGLSGSSACKGDITPPLVSSWETNPTDVTTLTVGGVEVLLTLADDCSGVDTTVDPHLWYRINNGSNPAWTDLGSMVNQGGNTWKANIPVHVWALHTGSNLQFYAIGHQDLMGNPGTTTVRNELVDAIVPEADPGFAYHDVNCDGKYYVVDGDVSVQALLTGPAATVIVPNCLVLPPSSGPVNVGASVTLTAANVTVQTDLIVGATNPSKIDITATTGQLTVDPGVTMTTVTGTIYLDATLGAMSVNQATLQAGQGVRLTAVGTISTTSATLSAGTTDILYTSSASSIDASGASITTASGGRDIILTANGDVDVRNGVYTSAMKLELHATLPTNTIYVDGATFDDNNGKAKVFPAGVTVVGTPASGGIE